MYIQYIINTLLIQYLIHPNMINERQPWDHLGFAGPEVASPGEIPTTWPCSLWHLWAIWPLGCRRPLC